MLEARGTAEPHIPERDQILAAFRVRSAVLTGADAAVAITEATTAAPDAIVLRSLLFDDLAKDHPLRTRLVEATITSNANRRLLPKLLRETTYLTPVALLAREHRQIARRLARRIRESLDSGGLWRALGARA